MAVSEYNNPPKSAAAIAAATEAAGFAMASEPETGTLLRALAASKPGGRILEMGTGTGMGSAWLLDGMDAQARLTTVDRDDHNPAIAERLLGSDPRITFHRGDGGAFLEDMRAHGVTFDLIFADTKPGKFAHLDMILDLLAPGGLYVVDDLLPQPHWSAEHRQRVQDFLAAVFARPDLRVARFDWASGLLVAVRVGPGGRASAWALL